MMKYQDILLNDCIKNNLNDEEKKAILHSLLRDFIISKQELKDLYLKLDLLWEEEYDYITLGDLKHINQIGFFREIDVEKREYELKMRFNRKYYDFLVNKGIHSIKYTEKLINYVCEYDDIAFKYIAMSDIRIKHCYSKIDKETAELINEYAEYVKVYTLRDLWRRYLKDIDDEYGTNDIFEAAEDRIEKFIFNDILKINLNTVIGEFIYMIEKILVQLDIKTANSIKYNFLICDRELLDKDDYDIEKGKLKKVISNLYEKVNRNILEDIMYHIDDNRNVIDNLYSGYTSFINALIKEV